MSKLRAWLCRHGVHLRLKWVSDFGDVFVISTYRCRDCGEKVEDF